MGFHAKGHHQAQESLRRSAGAAVQFRGVHHALYVFLPSSLCPPPSLSVSIGFCMQQTQRGFLSSLRPDGYIY